MQKAQPGRRAKLPGTHSNYRTARAGARSGDRLSASRTGKRPGFEAPRIRAAVFHDPHDSDRASLRQGAGHRLLDVRAPVEDGDSDGDVLGCHWTALFRCQASTRPERSTNSRPPSRRICRHRSTPSAPMAQSCNSAITSRYRWKRSAESAKTSRSLPSMSLNQHRERAALPFTVLISDIEGGEGGLRRIRRTSSNDPRVIAELHD